MYSVVQNLFDVMSAIPGAAFIATIQLQVPTALRQIWLAGNGSNPSSNLGQEELSWGIILR